MTQNQEQIPQHDNTYVIDAESAAEMARLMLQDRRITEAMSGAIPDTISSIHTLLDLACGPGGWVLEIAQQYPQVKIVGIDISQRMIDYARAQAEVRGLRNVTFRVMDVTQHPLDFASDIFDLVNARFLFGFMNPSTWPKLVAECFRITRPGGVIRLTEAEAPIATSMASERLYGFFLQAFQRDGRALLPPGSRNFATTAFLRKYLRDVGCIDIQQRPYVLDYSAETDAHDVWCQNLEISLQLMAPFFLREEAMSREEFEKLYQQLQQDHRSDDFSALFFFLSSWGKKPDASNSLTKSSKQGRRKP